MPNLPIGLVPGHPGVQSNEELRRNILEVTLPRVIESLLAQPDLHAIAGEPSPGDIVFAGTFDEVNEFYYKNEWSDGLPIVPPTRAKVDAFLSFTDRNENEVLGIPLPDNRAATILSIAVNGVMAGCRPEYMPILIAIVEAMLDPDHGVEHSGNTPGADALIVLNGPIIKQLGFNYTQGVMRDGFRPNTSIGRFWRLYLRNVPGFLPHKTDKGTYGNTWRVVVAENEDEVRAIGWEPTSIEMGFRSGENTVTVARYTGGDVLPSVRGDKPEELLDYISDSVKKQNRWQLEFTGGLAFGMLRPLVFLSPILAQTIARAGWSKNDVKRYLFEHTKIPARDFERYASNSLRSFTIKEETRLGRMPKIFALSDDPERLVPLVFVPEDFMIVVTGDPLRTNAYMFGHNGTLGYPVARKINLPPDWSDRLVDFSDSGH